MTAAQDREFNRLYQATYASTYRRAFHLTKHRAQAEDLTQDAYVRAYQAFGHFDPTQRFGAWMYVIVTRLYWDLQRGRSRRVNPYSYDASGMGDDGEPAQSQYPDTAPDPEELAIERDACWSLMAHLDVLPPHQRETLLLLVDGLTQKEIADRLGVAHGTIQGRVFRARTNLERKQIYPALAG